MCGILGIAGRIPDRLQFRRALDLLQHRGPDGQGIWQQSETYPVTFGHRRLSILDISAAGHQPMQRGSLTITFNGEIYNFPELQQQLSKKGWTFQSGSDTEVLLAAWECWGPECLKMLNGMWAFAIWDSVNHQLILSRDRFGKKPLFYSMERDVLILASEMKAMAPLMSEFVPDHRFHELAASQYQYESTEHCLIKGIKRFPAGSYAVVSPEDIRRQQLPIVRFWDTSKESIEVPAGYAEQVAMFRDLFQDACRLRLRSDVPVGFCLSGGLDSSSVVCALHSQRGSAAASDARFNIARRAFVATFEGSDLDETGYARAVMEKTGIDCTYIEIDGQGGLDRLGDYTYLFEELYPTSPVSMMDTYRMVAQNNVKVTIDGHGGDELLSGYQHFRTVLNDAFPHVFLMKRLLFSFGYENPTWADVAHEFTCLHHGLRGTARFVCQWPFRKKQDQPDKGQFGYLNSALYQCFHQTVLPTLLRNYDRYSMATGVEIRMPFMDHRLVQFCFSLPWTSKAPRSTPFEKAILRDAMGVDLPEAVRYRRSKIGFSNPIGEWLQGPWKWWMLDTLASTEFASCSLLDARTVGADIRRIIANGGSHSFCERVWSSFTPFLWEKHFLKRCQGITV